MSFLDLSTLNLEAVSDSVPQWSVKTGEYRYVLYSTGKALVFKGDSQEPSYEVTPLGCTCPGDRYNSNPCKHRKALTFIGDGSSTPPEEGTVEKTRKASPIEEVDMDDLFG